jgi:Peptidase family M23
MRIKSRAIRFFIKVSTLCFIGLVLMTNFAFNYSYPSIEKNADKEYPKGYFRSPLDIKLFLAGTFGEMRPNHFHSGIDIRTNSQEGLPIYAVAEGYISRMRVQASGFGYALYITHPNGLVSVYAHLQKYRGKILEQMKKIQYEKKSFEIDTLLGPTVLPIEKSQIIAYGGNSGASQGPHLHFEIRDAVTEETINPMLFGFEVEDAVNPIIQAITFYPLDENSSINNLKNKQRFAMTGSRPNYTLNNDQIINAWGELGLGIETIDLQSNSSNQNGVYSIELKKNGERIFFSKVERFYFKDTRAINSHCDFKERNYSGRWVQKSFLDPGNPVNLYKDVRNRGRIKLEAGEIYNMEYIVKDAYGNTSTARFAINCLDANPYNFIFTKTPNDKNILPYQKENIISLGNFKATFPVGSFYDSVLVERTQSNAISTAFSSLYVIGNKNIPVHGLYDVWIKPEKPMTDFQKSKAVIVQQGKGYAGGEVSDNYVKGKAKTMGAFYIAVDSIAPSIRPVNISNGRKMSRASKIVVKIGDNLSGIKSYNAYIDDEWVVMEYDLKYAQLAYTFDEHCPPGKHVFRLVVTDMKNNKSQYVASFVK